MWLLCFFEPICEQFFPTHNHSNHLHPPSSMFGNTVPTPVAKKSNMVPTATPVAKNSNPDITKFLEAICPAPTFTAKAAVKDGFLSCIKTNGVRVPPRTPSATPSPTPSEGNRIQNGAPVLKRTLADIDLDAELDEHLEQQSASQKTKRQEAVDKYKTVRICTEKFTRHKGSVAIHLEMMVSLLNNCGIQDEEALKVQQDWDNAAKQQVKLYRAMRYIAYPHLYPKNGSARSWQILVGKESVGPIAVLALYEENYLICNMSGHQRDLLVEWIDNFRKESPDAAIFKIERTFLKHILGMKRGMTQETAESLVKDLAAGK
ncbi:hypothetical protein DFS34DRAFT_631080 [Phlyctochytrium arcticum]|nr:hypothetical protein DFS34DRAFT_631080 [Phlyctochytrium arcticum]